jgi:hypothetical protein
VVIEMSPRRSRGDVFADGGRARLHHVAGDG